MKQPLYQMAFDASTLLNEHPPQFRHAHKAALFNIAYPDGIAPSSNIEVTRWEQQVDEPLRLPQTLSSTIIPNYYDYQPAGDCSACVEWHVNFADPRLFVAYGSSLFAQDEMQVAEHPLLASIREALLSRGLPASTIDDAGPTPILIRHVERRLSISTEPDAALGRPFGLYGNRFKSAAIEVVCKATSRIDPPTYSNIIAMASLPGGTGEYTEAQIRYILATAVTAFAAARYESDRMGHPSAQVVIHSGFWGCGAFGGNRHLMTALQAIAARAARIGRFVFHSGDAAGARDANSGFDVADKLAARCGPECPLDVLLRECFQMRFQWGVSDGN